MSTRRSYTPISTPLLVKRSFSGMGLGLFAGENIPKGACIIEYVGREISEAEKYSSKSRYLFEIDSKKTLDGKPSINKAGYINHSHKPNAEPVIHKRRIYIFAKRAIPAGTEITYDYGKEYVDDYCNPCKCEKCAPELWAANKAAKS
jgi:SET domain-containing protein